MPDSDLCALCGHERDDHDEYGGCDVEVDDDFACQCFEFVDSED